MTTALLEHQYSNGVYIYAPDKTLTHFTGCLVEGLLDLGVTVKTNADIVTSRHASMPLDNVDLQVFFSEPVSGFDAYLVDISNGNTFIPLQGMGSAPVGYITTSDISVFCTVPEEHVLFSTHDSTRVIKPGRREPIAFGLSKRLIDATETRPSFTDRTTAVVHSFRPTLQQGVRALLDIAFVPELRKVMTVEHIKLPPGQYLRTLKASAICLAYGGDFYSPISGNDWFEKNQPDLFKLHSFRHVEDAAVLRWDSWRFWEALASDCVAVHLNFNTCGFNLPRMPEAWVHYIPLNLSDLKGSADEIWTRRDEWESIAAQGRAWALQHYAPQPVAERVLHSLMDSKS